MPPRYRRAFGCVTWVNMAILIFLLAAFLLPLPFRYVGSGDIFSEIQIRLALLGLVLILPGMALGAVLGARTYRVERRLGTRAGAGIGATAGLASYLLLFALIEGHYLLAMPFVVSAALLLYALFATGQRFERRWRIVLFAAALSTLSGDPHTLDMQIVEDGIRYGEYPDALERLWGCLLSPRCGDVVLSATPGHTFGEISGTFHAGSDHGSLHASDSNVFVLAAGFPGSADGFTAPRRITEVAPTLLAHFAAGAATATVDAGT